MSKKEKCSRWEKLAIWILVIAPTIIALLSIIFIILGYWWSNDIVRIVAICCLCALCALGLCGMICGTVLLLKLLQSHKSSEPSKTTMEIMERAFREIFLKDQCQSQTECNEDPTATSAEE